jgi:hypothetical protein
VRTLITHHLLPRSNTVFSLCSYVFVAHGKGPAVGGQGLDFDDGDRTVTSSDVSIRDNNIRNIKCWDNEIPADVSQSIVANDARGAVFQFIRLDENGNVMNIAMAEDGSYQGNVLADMQIMVAQAILDGTLPDDSALLPVATNTIGQAIIDWAASISSPYEPAYRCGGDAMHHVEKGIIVIRVEDTAGFEVERNSIRDITNVTPQPFDDCHDFHPGASLENAGEHQGGNIRGISVAAVRGYPQLANRHLQRRNEPNGGQNGGRDRDPAGRDDAFRFFSRIDGNEIREMESQFADVIIGIDVQGDSKSVKLESNDIDLSVGVGTDQTDPFIAIRLRSLVDGDGSDAVAVLGNNLRQEIQRLNINNRNLRKRATQKSMMADHAHHINEWENGGCPFARGLGKARRAEL